MNIQVAVFAGGCFWGMQDLFRKQPGVLNTEVGYCGGEIIEPTYRNHGNHAEALKLQFDADLTSYEALLGFLFQIHDPTTMDRQGNDRGPSYRSEIFYSNQAQQRSAQDYIARINDSEHWPGKVVTKLSALQTFWPAEPEHQDYLERNPNGYTCHYIRDEWVL